MNENDGFTLVTRQNKRRRRNKKICKPCSHTASADLQDNNNHDSMSSIAEQVKKIDTCKERIAGSKFYASFFATVESSINNWYKNNIASMNKSCNDTDGINSLTETVNSLENFTDPEPSTSLSNTRETTLKCTSFPSSLTISHIDRDTPSSESDSNSCNNDQQTAIVTNYKATAAIQEIVCYGLGNFLSSVTARYQLALLLLLMEKLQFTKRCFIYDPIFTSNEEQILQDYGLHLIKRNEECKRCVQEGTLFYMLHCERDMYNNLLASNWSEDNLRNVIIVGNCFSTYSLRFSCQRSKREAFYIYKALTFVTEDIIPNTFEYKDIFNDSAVLYFKVLNKVLLDG